jgi:DNA-binding transcriptional LysR family regulator
MLLQSRQFDQLDDDFRPRLHPFAGERDFVTALAKSLARRFTLKVLPVDLPDRAWPVVIITLKNRTLSPVVELFIERARQFTRPMCAEQPTPKQ